MPPQKGLLSPKDAPYSSSIVFVGFNLLTIGGFLYLAHRGEFVQELYNRGLVPLSRDSLDSIRKQKTFIQVHLKQGENVETEETVLQNSI